MSHAVRMHNKGRTIEEIAAAFGLRPAVVRVYLEKRPGWPGKLMSPGQGRRASTINDDGEEEQRSFVKRAVPSLPKLRFMGEA